MGLSVVDGLGAGDTEVVVIERLAVDVLVVEPMIVVAVVDTTMVVETAMLVEVTRDVVLIDDVVVEVVVSQRR